MTLQEFFLEVQLEVEVNSCVYDIAQVLKELPRRWSPVADVGGVVYVEDDGDVFYWSKVR